MSNEAVIVDMKTAQRLGDRTIGTIKHASWYEADDEYDLIEVNGEYYRIPTYPNITTYLHIGKQAQKAFLDTFW